MLKTAQQKHNLTSAFNSAYISLPNGVSRQDKSQQRTFLNSTNSQ
jgi:hypothetical protein